MTIPEVDTVNKNFVDEDDENEATRPELRQPSGFGLHALFSPLKKGLRVLGPGTRISDKIVLKMTTITRYLLKSTNKVLESQKIGVVFRGKIFRFPAKFGFEKLSSSESLGIQVASKCAASS